MDMTTREEIEAVYRPLGNWSDHTDKDMALGRLKGLTEKLCIEYDKALRRIEELEKELKIQDDANDILTKRKEELEKILEGERRWAVAYQKVALRLSGYPLYGDVNPDAEARRIVEEGKLK